MLKVFLVEDESVIRDGLRDGIPWQQYGFTLVGTASDGEVALPQIRKLRPDILITDIKMPFMDGLTLSRIVTEELPDTKTIIISGYDDFEYAQQAIAIGVEQYLLKPISKGALLKALRAIKDRMEEEQERSDQNRKYQLDAQEYEQYTRQAFFERLTGGALTVPQIYEQAKKLNIDLDASAYNIVLFLLMPREAPGEYSEPVARLLEELMQFFMRYSEYLPFRWHLMSYAVLIKGDASAIDGLTAQCVENIRRRCDMMHESFDWYVAVSRPVQRLSGLAECFAQANQILACRYLLPQQHVLTEQNVARPFREGSETVSLEQLDVSKVDASVIRNFLETGAREEVPEFVDKYLDSLGSAVGSLVFRQYLAMNVRFIAAIKVKDLGYTQEEFLGELDGLGRIREAVSPEELPAYLRHVLRRAIEFRDNRSKKQYRDVLRRAVQYIDQNFTDENISLNAVAKAVNISANYFSAVFSQEMGMTFVEYLTQKRMEKAKQLLRQTSKRSGEIAFEVGYRDPRYFSFIFKKTQGCTPSSYRSGEAGAS